MESVINNWKVIKTEEEYNNALNRLELIFDAIPGSAEFDEADLLGLLIKYYEDKHYEVPLLNPIDTLKVKMEDLGLDDHDLIKAFTSLNNQIKKLDLSLHLK